ncbi:MAG: L-serine ammonia-lyase [Alphaproteobacteria bacterium]|nr:L-serine ammonia-lyase [Alphaproteobacteria bacterium]
MFLSIFEIFKIGIGPSSSHTMGPMVAAARFLRRLRQIKSGGSVVHLSCSLHGSLAFTGKGHGTDRAIILGLLGETPIGIDPETIETKLVEIREKKVISLPDLGTFAFDPERDIYFDYGPPLPGHANGLQLYAHDANGQTIVRDVYYSIGGGFVMTETELADVKTKSRDNSLEKAVPYSFSTAREMLEMGKRSGLSIAEMKRQNELTQCDESECTRQIADLWQEMNSCIERGMNASGYLPGKLNIRRRAGDIYKKLQMETENNSVPGHQNIEWLGVYAMAVNEENAMGSKVVTAPTNGAAGVIPATIRYYLEHCSGARQERVADFLLTAAAIGGLIKHNASISGAEVGCQGEVGSASAMAAAGLCAVLGGSNEQIENASEIALEHHLGMTCDPIAGLVQVPCIERNALGAVKAMTAAALALRGDGHHLVSLDSCIETMRQIGIDMNERYKETSTGGLAVNVVEC